MNDIEVLEDIKTEEELYKYIINRATDKLPLEHEIFAIRNNDFHNLDYAIYVDGYISLDVIIRNIKKQEELENLLKERQSDKERIKELEESEKYIYEAYQDAGKKMFEYAEELENTIPKSLIKEKIEELKKYRDIAKELIEERVVIADSDSLNYGRAEAHDKDIQVLEELLKGE